jgi:hypothetical protein
MVPAPQAGAVYEVAGRRCSLSAHKLHQTLRERIDRCPLYCSKWNTCPSTTCLFGDASV